jgi:hypothetical protein
VFTPEWKHACRWLKFQMWENLPEWPEQGDVIPMQRRSAPTAQRQTNYDRTLNAIDEWLADKEREAANG